MYNDINDRIKKALLESLSLKTEMKSKTIESQKVCANAALNMLHIVDPHSCILGGAPRDWALGNPAKDLDIYIHGYPNESRDSIMSRISQALDLQENELEDVTKNSYYMHSLDNGVAAVFNVKNCFMPIQIILCDRLPIEMLRRFHGSLSKASYTRGYYWDYLNNVDDYELETSVEFDISKEFKVHLVRKGDDPKYIAKIQAKYPDFTTVYES
jgi:hypothetical protein